MVQNGTPVFGEEAVEPAWVWRLIHRCKEAISALESAEFAAAQMAPSPERDRRPTVVTNVPSLINEKAMRQRELLILPIAAVALLAVQTGLPSGVGLLNCINGPVSFQPAGVTEAEIHVGLTAWRLDSNTAFLNLDDRTIPIQLSPGNLTVCARNLAQNLSFELDTPILVSAVLRPGEYRIGAGPDSKTTTVTVRDGGGEATAGGQAFPVPTRHQEIVVGGDPWNSSRDRREDESPSVRDVSRELDGYEGLDQCGSWASQPGCGQVWMPSTIAAGWAAYHYRHRARISPWDWTWVDDTPWGFAPYPNGWASLDGSWGWVPGPYAAAVGWFTLGPREPYNDGRHPNGPAFNNIRYGNREMPNAVTSQRASVPGPRAGEASRAPRPPAGVSNRPVVVRIAPLPAFAALERQQAALNRNPGRPFAPATVRQIGRNIPAGSSPVGVEDMSLFQRIQPAVGGDPSAQPPNVEQQPNTAPPPVVNKRQNASPSDPAGRRNGRRATPVARPDAPPNAIPQRQNVPPPRVLRQPNTAPPPVNSQSSGPPPSRQQPEQRDGEAAPVQPNRPQAQDPQRQPPQQIRQTPLETTQPASRPKGDRGKPDKNDEKK